MQGMAGIDHNSFSNIPRIRLVYFIGVKTLVGSQDQRTLFIPLTNC